MTYTLHHGDCLEVMAGMEAGSVDAVVTDPPYGLAFMGKHWDHGLPGVDFWTEALRLLPPSHYLLAFGGTRTWHRLACALEDAGFEIRDTLMWLYGSGFPKGKACLKPAWEPVILARKPGPMRELGIEACRVGFASDEDKDAAAAAAMRADGDQNRGRNVYGGFENGPASIEPYRQSIDNGRWPANVVLDEEAATALDAETGVLATHPGTCRWDYKEGMYGPPRRQGDVLSFGDSGGPSRFFYCAKASRAERNAGLEGMEASTLGVWGGEEDDLSDGKKRCLPAANHHPTVKPVALMRWLVRLVAQPGDVVLDPFTGSGTTGVACVEEGRDFIGIEREAEYVEIARRRIEAAAAQLRMDVTA